MNSLSWQQTKLGDVITLKRGYDLRSADRRAGSIPVVSSAGITGSHSQAKVRAPGVVTGRYGTLGEVFFLIEDFWPLNTTLYVQDFKGNNPLFIYYLLKSLDFSEFSDKSSVPGLNRNHLHEMQLTIPPLAEQRAIAHILGTLDDKIELNRRMNATLEAIARAIFKSWFVDFDPVHAKARGEQPSGMDAETAALFPDTFEDSALGPIPAGWGAKPIGEVVTIVGGSTPSTAVTEYWENGTINWVTPKDLASLSSPVLIETSRQITEKGLAQISSGLLPKGAVLLSSRAPIGYLAMAEIPVAVNQGFIAMVCNQGLSNYYILWWAEANIESIKNRANGTTFLEVSKRNFRPIPVLVPSLPILDRFDSIAAALFRRITGNCSESQTLAALRDALLPRLISGEIRAPDLDDWHAFIERTAENLSDDPIRRPPQGECEEWDALE